MHYYRWAFPRVIGTTDTRFKLGDSSRRCDVLWCPQIVKPQLSELAWRNGACSRKTLDGTIQWRAGIAEIFTNDCQLDGDVLRLTNFNDREYTFDIKPGRVIAA